MQSSSTPVLKDLVLIGGGHSHVAVLKSFGMRPIPGVRLTVICRDVHTPYSGMLPGWVAGHYDYDEVHIDLGPLSQFANARFFHDEATGIDVAGKRVICRERPPVPFDVLSINTGSTPSMAGVSGASENVVPVKPISGFAGRWEALVDRVLAADGAISIGTVGAGAGGVELTLAMQFALRRKLEEIGRGDRAPEFRIFSSSTEILPTHHASVRRRFVRVLGERGIDVHAGVEVTRVDEGGVASRDGREWPLDEVVWVTQARAAAWLGESGLEVDEGGFVKIDETLRSASHPEIFAAGDVAASIAHPREKAGVFAVRQGPPLTENLRRALLDEPLEPFVPQRRFLGLISTGDRYAIASRGRFSLEGRWVWKWKDWIDRRFMEKYNDLPAMEERAAIDVPAVLSTEETLREISTVAMRCGGCGAKVGATVLERVLARLETPKGDDVLIGLDAPDDAAVTKVPEGKVLVQTIDSFRAMIDDPYVFGKISANHSLGDVFAMNAEAKTALAVATLPFAIESKIEDTLESLLRGALEVFAEAGVSLVGGHTSEGAELSLGFAINGIAAESDLLRKGGMRPGDRILLTKPIGTGTLFAAHMRLRAKGRWITAALESMLESNRAAASCLFTHEASSCTDVTGFGLLGHLVEMTKASIVDARLEVDAIPILDGARETVAMGILSSLQPQNVRLRRAIADIERVARIPEYPLLFDPQTAGGLLATVPGDRAEECVAALRELGYGQAAIIGEVRERSGRAEPIVIG